MTTAASRPMPGPRRSPAACRTSGTGHPRRVPWERTPADQAHARARLPSAIRSAKMPSASVGAYRIPSRTDPGLDLESGWPSEAPHERASRSVHGIQLAGWIARSLQRSHQDEVFGDDRDAHRAGNRHLE